MKNYLSYGAGIVGICITVGCVFIAQSNKRPDTTIAQVTPPDLQNDVPLQRECAGLFKDILKIQDDREDFRKNLNKIQKAFNQGEESHDNFSQARTSWLKNENALATQAAQLYSEGRTKGCFQKVEQ